MKVFSVALAALLLIGLATADEKLPAKVVRVTGTAEVKVVPDRAVIELGVEKQNSSASMAKQSADTASRRIIAALRGNGVDEKDIQTTFLSLQPQSYYRKGARISNFVAAQTMSVTVRDLPRLDALLEKLIKAGGNRIDSIRYETSNLRKYRDQARDLAMKAARQKGEALARALGQDIGKPQMIEEVAEPYQLSNGMANLGYEPTKSGGTLGPSTAAGQETISASVIVSFELL